MKPKTDDRPVRVAMVHYRDDAVAGGSLRVGETIANHVDPRLVSVEMVFAYGSTGPVAARSQVPCHFIGAKSPKDIRAWMTARSLFRRLQPDIVHFQDAVVWIRSALAATRYKTLVHIHARLARTLNTPDGNQKVHPFRASNLMRGFLRSTDAQVCINNGARQALLDLRWISEHTSGVVYNSIEFSRFSKPPSPAEARATLGLPRDVLLLGMVARLVWEKGVADLLPLLKLLPERWHGVICGDGPLRRELQRECEQLGLSQRVHFIGTHDDVVPVYSALDAYAFLSLYEPFGLVLAEAMATGLPVFGVESDGEFNEAEYPLFTGGSSQLVPFDRSGNYDVNVPADVLAEIARRITNFGNHPEEYASVIRQSQRRVRHCFDASVQAEAMTDLYRELSTEGTVSHDKLAQFYATRRATVERLTQSDAPEYSLAATG